MAILWAVALRPAVIQAGEIGEAQVIQLAQEQDLRTLEAIQSIALAEAEGVQAKLRPNPSIGWEREHFPALGSNGEGEDALTLRIPFDLSPRRTVRRHLAAAHVSIATAQAARTRSQAVVHAMTLFYQTLAEQHRVTLEQHALDQLRDAARVVTRRREAGAVSGYDQIRIEIEMELAASALRQTSDRAQRLHSELARSLGKGPDQVSFVGGLGPDARTETRTKADLGGDPRTHRPDRDPARASLRLQRDAQKQTRRASEAAARSWIPGFALSAGPRMARGDETRFGYVAGLAVNLPVFSRGQALRAQARAEQRVAQARADATQRTIAIERGRARSRLQSFRSEARHLDDAMLDRLDRLEKAAESGYREGARSIVELLDTRRLRTKVQTRRLELALSIKRAELALRAARGEFE